MKSKTERKQKSSDPASILFRGLDSPIRIQESLDRLDYDAEIGTRSPLWVAREKKANCFEGALFAAAALRALGREPLVVDMAAENDDDHVIAVFKKNDCWGAVAKSNFPGLRFREPVYRTIRELVMSYFDVFVNSLGRRSLRSYCLPVNLARYDRRDWVSTDADLSDIGDDLTAARHFPLITPRMARELNAVDAWLYKSLFLGTKKEGIYRAK